jgi:hydrogenase expression/formation protein HypC
VCLGIPARVVETFGEDEARMGVAEFAGTRRTICLACTPEAGVGSYVVVHAGFSVSQVDPADAAESYSLLSKIAPVR